MGSWYRSGCLFRAAGISIALGLSPGPAAAQAKDPLAIGVYLSLSGPAAPFGIPERDVIEILAKRINEHYPEIEVITGSKDPEGYDIVVNATPLGTRGSREGETPATAAQLRGARVAYDLVYNPSETKFLREASAAGCATVGGLQMLVAQAAEQFKLWTGADAPLEVMREAAERQMLDAGY